MLALRSRSSRKRLLSLLNDCLASWWYPSLPNLRQKKLLLQIELFSSSYGTDHQRGRAHQIPIWNSVADQHPPEETKLRRIHHKRKCGHDPTAGHGLRTVRKRPIENPVRWWNFGGVWQNTGGEGAQWLEEASEGGHGGSVSAQPHLMMMVQALQIILMIVFQQ